MFSLSKTQRRCRALAFALALVPLSASALAPTSTQGDTLKELIDVIEDRHYASRRYDDALSAQHFRAYLDALDPQRMFFDAADITDFSSWKLELDNAGRRGNLDPAFTMFNRYHEKLKARLQNILDHPSLKPWRALITSSTSTSSSITPPCPGPPTPESSTRDGGNASKIRR